MTTETPWRDKETLERLYWDERLTQGEVAKRLGCARRTIAEWMRRHDIETRKGKPQTPHVYLATWTAGYELWKDGAKPSVDDNVLVHRLLAVAKYGFDAVRDMDVHHKNGIPWDNRPDNIELMSPSDHYKKHHEELDFSGQGNPNAKLTQSDVDEIRARRNESSAAELAEEFGVGQGHIYSIWNGRAWSSEGVNGSA